MATDELEHAGWVKHLQRLAVQDAVDFEEGKTRTYSVRTFLDYLHRVEKDVDSPHLTINHALTLTLDLEQSLIEHNSYSRFIGRTLEICQILEILQEGLEEHVRRVGAYVKRNKSPSPTNAQS